MGEGKLINKQCFFWIKFQIYQLQIIPMCSPLTPVLILFATAHSKLTSCKTHYFSISKLIRYFNDTYNANMPNLHFQISNFKSLRINTLYQAVYPNCQQFIPLTYVHFQTPFNEVPHER